MRRRRGCGNPSSAGASRASAFSCAAMSRHRSALLTASLAATLALVACDGDPFAGAPGLGLAIFAPDVVSTTMEDEVGITFSADGREAYFARGGGRGNPPRIHVARFQRGAWTDEGPAPFSEGWDESPSLAPDGSLLLFSSRRDVPGWGPVRPGNNLWMVERTSGGWSRPVPLPGEVNRPRLDGGRGAPERSETGPLLLADGTLLYATDEEAEWGSDLYMAERRGDRFVSPQRLRISSTGHESHPALSPDGRFLVFQSIRDRRAPGELDLYVSERTWYGWGPPRLLPPPINTPDNDGAPSFSPDGRFLFFASDRGRDGTWSIYWVEAATAGLGVGGADTR